MLNPISCLSPPSSTSVFASASAALIHVEQVWLENRFTAEGRIMHDRVDSGKRESRRDVRIACTVSLRLLRLKLVGKADVVEFYREKILNRTGHGKVNHETIFLYQGTPAGLFADAILFGGFFRRPGTLRHI